MTECTYVLLKQKDQGNLTGTKDLKREKKFLSLALTLAPSVTSGKYSNIFLLTK